MQRNHQSHTCQNHNVDPETFESPRSERLGSLKIAIVQKSLRGEIPSEIEEALRNTLLTVFFTIYPVYTVNLLQTAYTAHTIYDSEQKRDALLEWIPFRLLRLLEHLRC